MRRWVILLTCLWLAACAQSPLATRPADSLLQDQRFAAPRERIAVDQVFALSDEMQQYLRDDLVAQDFELQYPQMAASATVLST